MNVDTVSELVGPDYRVAVGAALKTCFALGQMMLGLIAWWVPHWRNLTLTLYIPQFLTIVYFWIIGESARWYMSKGRFKESEALLKKIAKVNGRNLSDTSLEALRNTAEEKKRVTEAKRLKDEPWLVVKVFRHKRILVRCVVSPVWWITVTFIYYGLSMNAVNLTGNTYLNFISVAAVEIPGFWTAYFLMDKIGRKPVLTGAFWMCAACQIAYIFMPQGTYVLTFCVNLDPLAGSWFGGSLFLSSSFRSVRSGTCGVSHREVQHRHGAYVGVRVHDGAVSHQPPTQPDGLLLNSWTRWVHPGATHTSFREFSFSI